jgi:hypothetical protein
MEERTDMACFAELGAGKANRWRSLLHGEYLSHGSPA